MISTANYVARRWGVRSAMPGFIGQALCRRGPEFGMPKTELVFVHPDFAKYERVAGIARAIFAQYDPHFRAYSADEAYIDLTRYLRCRVACGDHASARAMLADEALESGASRLAEAREAAWRVEELEPELEALRAAAHDQGMVVDDQLVITESTYRYFCA